MPRGDGTGPNGQGSRTGRGLGHCNGYNLPGFMNQGVGRGRGFGFRARSVQSIPAQQPQVITEKQEKQMLESDLKDLKAEIQEIEKRLKEIKK